MIIAVFEKIGSDFAKHLVNKAADYDLETLVSDVFDTCSICSWLSISLKNQFDFKFLAEHYRGNCKNF